jgi:hypothetical protein
MSQFNVNEKIFESDNSSAENQIVVSVCIKVARGLPVSLSNFIFCQYLLWGFHDSTVVPSAVDNNYYLNTRRNNNNCDEKEELKKILRFL